MHDGRGGGARSSGARRRDPLLAVVTAIIIAVEFAVVGLLPPMARDLGVSLAQAGGLVSAFAFAAAFLGPILTLAAARFEPRPTPAAYWSTRDWTSAASAA